MTEPYSDLLIRIGRMDAATGAYPVEAELDDGSAFAGELRLDWFRRSDKGFDVVMLYEDEKELERGKRLLTAKGFQ